MSEPNAANLAIGAGNLWYAAIGSPEPAAGVLTPITSPATTVAWPSQWTQLGYTTDGNEFTFTPKLDPIEVAENLYVIKYVASGVMVECTFDMAEITATHLALALNGATLSSSGGITSLVPPILGSEKRIMLGWDRIDGLERIIMRRCIQTAAVKQTHKKAPNLNTIPATFALEVPTSGPTDLYTHYFDNSIG
jgi:hypothetical protein